MDENLGNRFHQVSIDNFGSVWSFWVLRLWLWIGEGFRSWKRFSWTTLKLERTKITTIRFYRGMKWGRVDLKCETILPNYISVLSSFDEASFQFDDLAMFLTVFFFFFFLSMQFSHHRNIATYFGAFIKKSPPGKDDQLWVSHVSRVLIGFRFFFFWRFFSLPPPFASHFPSLFFHWITEFCFGWVARYRVVVSSFYTVARLKKPFFVLFIVSLRTVIGPFWIEYSVSVFYRLHRCRISKISFLFVQIECSTLFFGTFSFRFRFEEISFTLRCNFLPIFRCTYFTFWSSWSCDLNLKDLSLNRLNEKSILLMWLVRFFSLVRFWTLVCCCFAAFRSGRDFLWNWTAGDLYYVVIHSAIVRARRRRRRPCGRVQLVMEYCGAGSMTDLVKCESPVSSSIHHMPCSSFSLHSLFDSVEDDRLVFFDSFFLGAWNWVRQAQEAMR